MKTLALTLLLVTSVAAMDHNIIILRNDTSSAESQKKHTIQNLIINGFSLNSKEVSPILIDSNTSKLEVQATVRSSFTHNGHYHSYTQCTAATPLSFTLGSFTTSTFSIGTIKAALDEYTSSPLLANIQVESSSSEPEFTPLCFKNYAPNNIQTNGYHLSPKALEALKKNLALYANGYEIPASKSAHDSETLLSVPKCIQYDHLKHGFFFIELKNKKTLAIYKTLLYTFKKRPENECPLITISAYKLNGPGNITPIIANAEVQLSKETRALIPPTELE